MFKEKLFIFQNSAPGENVGESESGSNKPEVTDEDVAKIAERADKAADISEKSDKAAEEDSKKADALFDVADNEQDYLTKSGMKHSDAELGFLNKLGGKK